MNLNSYDTIILDCDGVIFDSNNLKLDAFRDALNDYDNNIVDDFIEYFKISFGTSRYNLAKVFITEFLKIEFDEKLYQEILLKYSKNCVILYQNSCFTDGFLDFIQTYKDKKIFIASGSDEEELKEVFKTKKLNTYFIDIFGSPKKKKDIVFDIVKKHNNAIMIGDAKSDMLSAQNANIDFIFMKQYSTNEEMKKDKTLTTINNLGDLIE